MENEDMSIDVDEFVDSGIEAAGDKLEKLDAEQGVRPADEEQETSETETKLEGETETKEQEQAEKETEEVETETSDQTDSTISALFKGTEKEQEKEEDQRVPLEEHIKLRKRAQAAEEKVKELEARQTTQTEGEDSGKDFLKDHEDEDLVRAGDVRKEVEKIEEKAVQKAVGQINKILEQRTQKEQLTQSAIKAVQSEAQVKKDNPDYDTVTKAANKLGLLNDTDRQVILKDDNPAKKYYELAKAKLTEVQASLGITQSSTSKNTTTTKEETGKKETEEEEEMTDDEVFDAVYGGEEK